MVSFVVVSIPDDKILVDDGITVGVGLKVTPIIYFYITQICNKTISYQVG